MQFSEWEHAKKVEKTRAMLSDLVGLLVAEEIPIAIANLQCVEAIFYEDPQAFYDAVWKAYSKSGSDGIYSLRGGMKFYSHSINFPVDKDQIVIQFYREGKSLVHHFRGL